MPPTITFAIDADDEPSIKDIGSRVRIVNTSRPELNGEKGMIKSYSQERFVVESEKSGTQPTWTKSFRPCNLRLIKKVECPPQKKNSRKKYDSAGFQTTHGSTGQGSPCDFCGARRTDVKRSMCSGCKLAVYCNRECQVADWKNHKRMCKLYRKTLKEAGFKDPDKVSSMDAYHAGVSFGNRRNRSKAIDMYRLAIRKNPNFIMARNNLCTSLRAIGDNSQGLVEIKKAVDILNANKSDKSLADDASRLMVYTNYGNSLKDDGQLKEAIDQYNFCLDNFSHRPSAELEGPLGNCGQATSRYYGACHPKTLEIRLKFIKHNPRSAIAYYNLGCTYRSLASKAYAIGQMQGKLPSDILEYKEALKALKKSKKLDPRDPDTYGQIAGILAEMGKHEEAKDEAKAALKIHPGHPAASHILRFL